MKKKSLYTISIIVLCCVFVLAVILLIFSPNVMQEQQINQLPDTQSFSADISAIPDDMDILPYDGWYKEDGYWYYRDSDGNKLYGWQYIATDYYYLMPYSGKMAHDCWIADADGMPCYVKEDGILVYGGLSWIGDSLTANWYPSHALHECFYNPTVVAKALKCPYEDNENNPSGITAAKSMVMAGSMENTLVFEMGSNNDWHTPELTYTDKIHLLQDIVGKSNLKIILVTCYTVDDETTESYYGEINREMRKLAEENINIAVADWAAVCDPETDLNPKDGMHHKSPEAAMKYMKLIQQTLLDNFGPFYYENNK